jgi:hypothetical protein
MMPIVLWSLSAVALLACGWLASAWFHNRKIGALRQQVKAVRQTATEHANQARRQIAQLQTEIESRKAAVPPARRMPEAAKSAPDKSAQAVISGKPKAIRTFVPDKELMPPGGFAQTTIVPRDGFASTEVMEA